jgi:DNA-binding transcriptional MerR regulator
MSGNELAIRSECRDILYPIDVAARCARVSEAFIDECEREELIRSHTMIHGRKGYRFQEIRLLIRIRTLHHDLGLDLPAIECILRMRQQIMTLRQQIAAVEHRSTQREAALRSEIHALRRRLAL